MPEGSGPLIGRRIMVASRARALAPSRRNTDLPHAGRNLGVDRLHPVEQGGDDARPSGRITAADNRQLIRTDPHLPRRQRAYPPPNVHHHPVGMQHPGQHREPDTGEPQSGGAFQPDHMSGTHHQQVGGRPRRHTGHPGDRRHPFPPSLSSYPSRGRFLTPPLDEDHTA